MIYTPERYKNRERFNEQYQSIYRFLSEAVVYEACLRAKALGAKRAIVLSDNEFYFRNGFRLSSEVYNWGI